MLDIIAKDAISKQVGCTDDYDVVFDNIDLIEYLNNVSRTNGLLALQDEVNDLVKDEEPEGLKRLTACALTDIIDGNPPEGVERILCNKYLANDYQGREAVAACIIISGILNIQAGANLQFLMREMLSLLPDDVEREYLTRKNEKEKELKNKWVEAQQSRKKEKYDIPEDFFEIPVEEIEADLEPEPEYLAIDDLLLYDKRLLQTILTRVPEDDLICAIYAMSADTRRAVMENMSRNRAYFIYMRIDYSERPRYNEIVDGCVIVMKTVQGLINEGEIVVSRGDGSKNGN